MKRIGYVVLWVAIFVLLHVAYADDTGIKIIGGEDTEAGIVHMDDFKPGDTVIIDGFGEVTFLSARWCDDIAKWSKGAYYYSGDWGLDNAGWSNLSYYSSGSEAEYLLLQFNILNLQTKPYNFYNDFNNIVCTYDDEYSFGGWIREYVTQNDSWWSNKSLQVLSDTAEGSPIDTMYRGRYGIVITLPNDVYTRTSEKENSKSLTVDFNIGENGFRFINRS